MQEQAVPPKTARRERLAASLLFLVARKAYGERKRGKERFVFMNPQSKNGIDWCDYTWSPVTGCLHGCSYCYARRLVRRFGNGGDSAKPTVAKPGDVFPAGFSPTFYPHRLGEPMRIRKPSRIFAVSAGDLFGEWVPEEWIESVLDVARQCSRHTFIFLTKNPRRLPDFLFPPNAWAGVTIDGTGAASENEEKMMRLRAASAPVRFVSFEPLLNRPAGIRLNGVGWVIVGAMTGPGAAIPNPEWIREIIDRCRKSAVPVFVKQNIKWPEKIEEYPSPAL